VLTAAVAIEVSTPFAGRELLAFLSHRAIAGVERIDGARYRRTVALAHGPGAIQIELPDLPGSGHGLLGATVHVSDPADLDQAAVLCRRLADADADPGAIDATLAADPALAPSVADVPGIRVPGSVDGAEILFRALWGQQVSVAAARTVLARLTIQIGAKLDEPLAGLTHLFPTPAAIAELGADGLAGPRRRAETIASAAHDLTVGTLDLDPDRPSRDVVADLVRRPGVGPWTAGYLAMRWLGDSDVLLSGDLVLRQGAATVGLPSTPAALSAHARRWQPYCSYAGLHLWRAAPAAGRTAPGG
jgi:AraC family transcriptional regulator of adaptative response / DNA-3-methyladenine glycosylase II